jgi:hypothetical protein
MTGVFIASSRLGVSLVEVQLESLESPQYRPPKLFQLSFSVWRLIDTVSRRLSVYRVPETGDVFGITCGITILQAQRTGPYKSFPHPLKLLRV